MSSGSSRPSVCCPSLAPTPRKLKRRASISASSEAIRHRTEQKIIHRAGGRLWMAEDRPGARQRLLARQAHEARRRADSSDGPRWRRQPLVRVDRPSRSLPGIVHASSGVRRATAPLLTVVFPDCALGWQCGSTISCAAGGRQFRSVKKYRTHEAMTVCMPPHNTRKRDTYGRPEWGQSGSAVMHGGEKPLVLTNGRCHTYGIHAAGSAGSAGSSPTSSSRGSGPRRRVRSSTSDRR